MTKEEMRKEYRIQKNGIGEYRVQKESLTGWYTLGQYLVADITYPDDPHFEEYRFKSERAASQWIEGAIDSRMRSVLSDQWETVGD